MAGDELEGEVGETEAQQVAEVHPMDALLESEDYDLDAPKRGEIRLGTIARVTEADVLVDIGAKSEGIISGRELDQLPDEQRANLAIGQEINVYVVRSGGRGGAPELSLSRAAEEQDWVQAEELLESKEIYEGEITGYNKGGLIVRMGRLRGFVPASQVSQTRRRRAVGETPEQRWGEMVGEQLVSRVIEVDRRRNRLILSERSAAREAREALKERLISELAAGETRTGHVISLADFGAFVDIGGADGLVHISEISWKRVGHPKEVLSVGQEVRVKVLGVDPDRNRISLSIRALEDNPWEMIYDRFSEGQLVEGTVTKLTKFGAFAAISGLEDYGIEGLIHISELSDRHIAHPNEVIQEGQKITMRVLRVDVIRHRIGLSLKRVDSTEYADLDWQTAVQEQSQPSPEPDTVADFDAELEAEQALSQPEPSEAGSSAAAEDAVSREPDAEPAAEPDAEPDAEPQAESPGAEPEREALGTDEGPDSSAASGDPSGPEDGVAPEPANGHDSDGEVPAEPMAESEMPTEEVQAETEEAGQTQE